MARVLIIGGTRFMGFFLTEELLAKGHDLTLLHRGNTVPGGVPNADNVIGDRESSLDRVEGHFDAVIDTSGMLPRQVRLSTAYAKNRLNCARYVYISTVSVYRDPLTPFADESAPRCASGDPSADSVTMENYGALKAACEDVVLDAFADEALIVRPGLMVGPRDQSDRFTYWVRRLSAGGEVLAPGDPDALVQIIDARDLARWIADMVERRMAGVYNATGPAQPLTFGELLLHCQRQSERTPELRWVSDEELADAGIEPGNDLPLWVPKADAEAWGSISSAEAQQQGLNYRPIDSTIAETLQWDRQRGSPPLKCGLTLEREQQLLSVLGR